ncbi:MAG: putative efflux pump rane fusion protein [Verrucomicrobia bacterium]|nr:putative efflux pump rane fusion protein [Verrucomicrobiota bacterium]
MRPFPVLALVVLALGGCARHEPPGFQGYLEGEFVYVGSPLAGRLEVLAVEKGKRVEAGTPLFTLERTAELAAQRQAADQLAAATARLEDLKKGSRPSELAALGARVDHAKAAAELSRLELGRQEALFKNQVISSSEFDRVRLAHEQDVRSVEELSAQLSTAQLGGRSDAIAAATADARAAAAAKERADWNVEQKSQAATRAGLVYDTLYRPGEFVVAGNPVVVLLPPENIKARFFVPEGEFAGLKAGDTVRVSLSGRPALAARISYLSPQPEYTPPVLYNRANRSKLVFLVEAVFEPADARDLHPGQPVDVTVAR